MSEFPYTIAETLHTDRGALVYRAVRTADGSSVIVKMLDPRRSRPRDLERLKNEYNVAGTLNLPTAVKVLAFETHEGKPTLIMEDFGGESLDRLLGAPLGVDPFLHLAVHIAAAVADIHRHGLVHKDIKPANIIVHALTGEVKLDDFGIASRLPREHKSAESPRLIEGSLPYLAPEQTGRMNRTIDNRADLYALGVTFYEMLTGRLPFAARDPLEWVHCHVARVPQPPSALVPELPETLSAIVLKLLAKMAEDRYQTARGLQHDLERCAAEWRATGRLTPFPLAEHDVSGRFQIPQKLYGREAAVATLLSAFDRVAVEGVPELLLVSGYSGIGKSALVHELHKPVVRERGFFAAGKFDQYQRDIPYSTIVQAFRDLVLEILAESEEQIAAWRERLLGALGINGQLIVNVIPQVELVIGPQPPVPELPQLEAQNRFRIVFRHFIGVFAQKQHPLVLFLDDLQWADAASLGLLQDVMTHPEMGQLFIIGAYRDNEVLPSHPLLRTLEAARTAGARVSDIVLGPLSREQLATLVSDTLRCHHEDAAPLAELVYEKTGGNPFFALQFLTAIYEERLMEFDERAGAWRWDMAKIRAKGFTDNAVHLMVGKLARLPASTQEALKQLAALGNVAEVATLAMVHGRSEEMLHADLWEAACAGLVLRMEGSYKFLHDRVQEAAYSLIPQGERAAVHLTIGRRLSSHTPPEEQAEKIFEIVNQLDRGAELITSREERERVAELNLVAGRRAMASTAYASANNYLAAGSRLLAEDSWDRRYELAFALELHRAECEFLTGELPAADERLSLLSRRAQNLVDAAAVTCVRVDLYTTQNQSDRAINAGLEYLRRIGIEWSPHPAVPEIRQEYDRLWRELGSRSIEALIELPEVTEPRWRATMDVLARLIPAAIFTDENLLCLIPCRMANLCLEHGNSDASCFAYVWVGMLLRSRFGDYRSGFRFGKLAFDLVEKRRQRRFKARVYMCFGSHVNPWTRHVRTGIDLVRRAFEAAQETGDLTFAAYTRNNLITLLLADGHPLGDVQREVENALEFTRKARFGLIVDIITGQLRLIRTLRGLTPDFTSFNDAQFDEARFEQHLEGEPRLAIATCWYWIRKLQARFYAGDYAVALEAATKAERLLWTSPTFFEIAEYHFYGALARAARYDAAPTDERAQHLEALAAHHQRFAVWAENSPESFQNRAALIAAEIARIEGRDQDAMRLYEEAIRSARDSGFVHNEALAYELASRFYRIRGFVEFADTYLRDARACYARWGAEGKVQQIDRHLPRLETKALSSTATFAAPPEQLDLLSVTKASQTISSEIVLDKLVRTLLEVVLAQGGAQRACLLLYQEGHFSIEAEAALEEQGAVTSTLGPLPLASSQHIPASLVHYARRTQERVILNDASADAGKFSGDAYFARHRPKSVVCMPILRQAEVVGLLYLENNLLAGAFTPDRLLALELLATQAAISLEKAQLLGKEQAARAAAEAAERRSTFIAEAGALLSESLDYEKTLDRLSRLCVRSLADWCVIDVVTEGGDIQRIAGAHTNPAKEPLLHQLQMRYPARWGSPHPAAWVLQNNKPILLPELADESLQRHCQDDEHLRLIRELGTRTGLAVPLVVRGQTLGVLSMASAAPGYHYGRVELGLAQEVAYRAALALDNSRLYREAQQAVRARDEFLTVASHELRTPMTSLSLSLLIMQRMAQSGQPADPANLSKVVARAMTQGERMTRLINDLLDVSRIATGQFPLDLTHVELDAVVHDVVERFESELTRTRCQVVIRNDAPVTGRWDRSQIDQVVTNLLHNAIKFGPGEPVEVSIGVRADMAQLVMQDHGIGIEPTRQARIFDRFERAVSARHYGGLGLGLYISRCIVEAHGGTIRVESRLGEGSTFTVELPCAGPALDQGKVHGHGQGASPAAS